MRGKEGSKLWPFFGRRLRPRRKACEVGAGKPGGIVIITSTSSDIPSPGALGVRVSLSEVRSHAIVPPHLTALKQASGF